MTGRKPSLDELRETRRVLPDVLDAPFDLAVLGILLDDLIERQEDGISDDHLLAECDVQSYRRGWFGRWVKVIHRPTGVWAEGVDPATALRLIRPQIFDRLRAGR